MTEIGRVLIFAGLGIFLLGLILTAIGRVPGAGRLPGDFVYRGDNITVFAPIGTMILLSLILTIAINIVVRFLR
ncbi:DUF2905 domain-containing protein [Chloroflexi bacterium TSY]|nr:DUF2905 domain-containing protein [Chloroflexi bacterium TSY]